MPLIKVKEVQITLENGRVMDFKVALGDKIGMQQVDTYIGNESHPIKYYTLNLTPSQQPEE